MDPIVRWLTQGLSFKISEFCPGPDAFLFINSSLLYSIVLMCLCNRILTYLYNWVRPARKLTRGWPHTPQWPGTSGSRRPGRAETWRRPGRWYRPAWSGWCRSAPVNKSKVSYRYVGAKIRIRHSVSTEITLTNTGTELSMIDNELIILHILFWIVHTFKRCSILTPNTHRASHVSQCVSCPLNSSRL